MAYNYEDDLPATYPTENVLESALDCQWRLDRHREAEHDPLNRVGHSELFANFGRVVDKRTLRLYDLGATAYEIATLPELVDLEIEEDEYQDPAQFQAAIDIANTLRDYDPFDLLKIADEAAEILREEVPEAAKLVVKIAELMQKKELDESEKRRVWAGAGIMRSFRIMEQLKKEV